MIVSAAEEAGPPGSPCCSDSLRSARSSASGSSCRLLRVRRARSGSSPSVRSRWRPTRDGGDRRGLCVLLALHRGCSTGLLPRRRSCTLRTPPSTSLDGSPIAARDTAVGFAPRPGPRFRAKAMVDAATSTAPTSGRALGRSRSRAAVARGADGLEPACWISRPGRWRRLRARRPARRVCGAPRGRHAWAGPHALRKVSLTAGLRTDPGSPPRPVHAAGPAPCGAAQLR